MVFVMYGRQATIHDSKYGINCVLFSSNETFCDALLAPIYTVLYTSGFKTATFCIPILAMSTRNVHR